MKTYFLALNKDDFSKNGRTWRSETIDLYSNKYYNNYSTLRSEYGNNLIGDYTYTGLQVYSDATPTLEHTTLVTDQGEVVLEPNVRNILHI